MNGETPHKLRKLEICRQLFRYDLCIYLNYSCIYRSRIRVDIQETDYAGIPCFTPCSIYPCCPEPAGRHVMATCRFRFLRWSSSSAGSPPVVDRAALEDPLLVAKSLQAETMDLGRVVWLVWWLGNLWENLFRFNLSRKWSLTKFWQGWSWERSWLKADFWRYSTVLVWYDDWTSALGHS